MTDNPFDDLGAIDDDESDPDRSEPSESSPDSSGSATDPTPDPTQATETLQSADSSGDGSARDRSEPPFEYSEVRQRPLYARGEMWDEFEDAVGISVIPELRKEGIRNEEKREIHDAVLTLAAEEPQRVVEIILERRRQSQP